MLDRGFGDSQSLKTTPGEHPQQPIEASHLGPAQAITGPAARGDAATARTQLAAVARWSGEAGAIYQALRDAAYRLACEDDSLALAPHP